MDQDHRAEDDGNRHAQNLLDPRVRQRDADSTVENVHDEWIYR